jgi:hypothetical protein
MGDDAMEPVHAAMIFVEAHAASLAPAAGVFVGALAASLAVGSYVVVHLPADYLHRLETPPFLPGRPEWVRIVARVGKNLLGVVVIGAGVSLTLRAVLGPGMLGICVGLVLLDIPGKRGAELRLFGVRRVHKLANRIRARFGRPPLELPTCEQAALGVA